jgi:hypothetical protein
VERIILLSEKGSLFILGGLICSLIFLAQVTYSQEALSVNALEYAQKALDGYVKNIINESNASTFGFKNIKEAQAARLGKPLSVMIIGLRDLKNYKAGTGAKQILIDAKTLWFPVVVDSETRCKLEIIEKNGKWIAGEFGRVKSAAVIMSVQIQLPKLLESQGIKEPFKEILVRIPSLYAEFVYVVSSKGEFLIPAMLQSERYGLENGQVYEADEVLIKLKEIAQKIDENKVM